MNNHENAIDTRYYTSAHSAFCGLLSAGGRLLLLTPQKADQLCTTALLSIMWGPGTIESDDDVAADDSSSEEEEKESVFDAKRTKKTKAVESKGPVTAKEINPDFEYGSDDGEATPSGGCSWNFQAAIQKIQEQDKADGFDNSGGVDYLQKKINEKRRRRRITEKKAKDDAAAGMTPKEALAAAKKAK